MRGGAILRPREGSDTVKSAPTLPTVPAFAGRHSKGVSAVPSRREESPFLATRRGGDTGAREETEEGNPLADPSLYSPRPRRLGVWLSANPPGNRRQGQHDRGHSPAARGEDESAVGCARASSIEFAEVGRRRPGPETRQYRVKPGGRDRGPNDQVPWELAPFREGGPDPEAPGSEETS